MKGMNKEIHFITATSEPGLVEAVNAFFELGDMRWRVVNINRWGSGDRGTHFHTAWLEYDPGEPI